MHRARGSLASQSLAMSRATDRPAKLLAAAAAKVVGAPGSEPWNYGWCIAEYRASPEAGLEGPGGPVTIDLAARGLFEEAVSLLSRELAIRERWNLEELWGIVASEVVAASAMADPESQLRAVVGRLRNAETNLVLMTVANVAPPAQPLVVADCVLGQAGDELARAINALAGSRPQSEVELLDAIDAQNSLPEEPTVVAAAWTQAQRHRAVEPAEATLSSVFDVTLLLEPDLGRVRMHSLRGAANRPGTRGVTIHRPALETAMSTLGASAELAAEVRVVSRHHARSHAGWYRTDPVPIAQLLVDPRRRALVSRYVRDATPVARRVRLAARWNAEAHWAGDQVDAVLALGVALDALIGSRSALPGRAMRERYALLEAEPAKREERARRHSEIYSVRSAVAHGGASSKLDEPEFVRRVSRDVAWTANRMIAFDELFAPASEQQLDDVFECLRWGTARWQASALGG